MTTTYSSIHRTLPWLFAATLLALTSAEVQAKSLSGKQIFEKAHRVALYQGDTLRAKMTMTISEKSGKKRVKQFTACRRNASKSGSDQDFFLYFHKPAHDARTAYLIKKKSSGDDDRWMHLPALNLVKRIAPSDKRTSFAGSDFLYEDVSGRDADLDTHTLEAASKNSKTYVVLSTPKKTGDVEFQAYRTWIHKKSFVPIKMVFYKKGRKGKKPVTHRTITVDRVETIAGFKTITKTTAVNQLSGTKTVMEAANVKYDGKLKASHFTLRYLKRKPTACLKL